MGSSIPHSHLPWVVLAALSGVLYLVFDAARYFVLQLSPVRLRRLTGDPQMVQRRGKWTRFDAENFQLVSGALLQIALIGAYGASVLAFDISTRSAWLQAGIVWTLIIIAWKLLKGILGLVVGIAIAAVIFVGAKNLLSGDGTKRIK